MLDQRRPAVMAWCDLPVSAATVAWIETPDGTIALVDRRADDGLIDELHRAIHETRAQRAHQLRTGTDAPPSPPPPDPTRGQRIAMSIRPALS